jgi:hypothetical protein
MPRMLSLSDLSFDQMQLLDSKGDIVEWKVPKWETTRFMPLMTRPQRAAISFFFLLASTMTLAGLVLPLVLWNWYWLLLIPLGVVVFKANRRTVDQIFLVNLKRSRPFYEAAVSSGVGVLVGLKVAE